MISFAKLKHYEGNEVLFDLVMMSIVSTLSGEALHLHAEGLRGTGKTTIMRATKGILPKIKRIKGCIYNCDPESPHCPHHRNMTPQEIALLSVEEIPMPFLEISHSSKVGTVAGSIDLALLTDTAHPEANLLPGIIPQAHRGIIFIDEINRLADTSPEVTDILLDVMGNKPGHIQIEEAGIPVVDIPVNVSVWAASNPDEDPGPLEEIRRQLSDRFDLVCNMGRPTNVDVLSQILKENVHINKGNCTNENKINEKENSVYDAYRQRIVNWAERYSTSDLPDFLRNYIARLYVKHNLESLRAIEAMQQGALLYSIIKDRDQATIQDLTHILPQVFKHRVDGATLIKMVNDVDTQGTKDGMFNFNSKRHKGKEEKEPTDYFTAQGRPLRDLGRSELINTEKTLKSEF